MKNLLNYLAVFMLGAGLAMVLLALTPDQETKTQVAVTVQLPPLLEQAERAIALAAPKRSSVKNKLTASMITQIAESTLTERSHQEFWITLLGVESRFDGKAKSPTGAIGLGQLIPSYYRDFGKSCGLEDVEKEDLHDDYTNATLSACYFKAQIEQQDGNIPLAIIAYNCGLHCADMKRAKAGLAPSGKEPSEYLNKVVLQREMQK